MRAFLLILIGLISIKVHLKAQNKGLLPIMSNEQRDSMVNIKEGYCVLNSNTGCLNYYYNKNWMEICGTCSPNPLKAKIDSVVYEHKEAKIFFSPLSEGCTYKIKNNANDQIFEAKSSPFVTKELKQNSRYQLKCQTQSRCGLSEWSEWSKSFLLQPKDYCQGLTSFKDKRNNISYSLMSFGKSCWMLEPLAIDPNITATESELKIEDEVCYYSWKFANYMNNDDNSLNDSTNYSLIRQGVCPAGWHLPNQVEVLALIEAFEKSPDQNFFKNSYGAYDFTNKQVRLKKARYYWISLPYGFFMSVGANPTLAESADPLGMPVRCVKD